MRQAVVRHAHPIGDGRSACAALVVVAALLLGLLPAAPAAAVAAPNTLSWTQQAPSAAPSARTRAASAYDPVTHQLVLFGGISGAQTNQETWLWSGTTWTQQSPASSPAARAGAAMAWDAATSQLLLFGGGGPGAVNSDTWVWSGTTWTQLSPAAAPPARTNAALAYSPAGHRLVLFGGDTASGGRLGDTWTWDGASWTQSGGAAPSARSSAAFAPDPATGRAVLFGGLGASAPLGDTWEWTGASWTQRSPAASPSARSGAAIAFDPRIGRPTLVGGSTAAGDTAEIWTWDGGVWAQTATTAVPTARDGASTAWFPPGGDLVLFGGSTPGASADTWTSDVAPVVTPGFVNPVSGGPPARSGAASAFDEATGQLVLFGGTATDGTPLADTWLWTGTAWVSAAPAASPPARAGASLAFDPATGQLLLFGGAGASGDMNDTWNWTGTTWTQLTTATLPAVRERSVLAFAYGTAPDGSGQMVLFGGLSGSTVDSDTWLWTGSDWARPTAAQSGTTPTKRYGCAAGWDPATGQLLVVSGSTGTTSTNSTWAWGATGWQQLVPTTNAPTRVFATLAFDDATHQLLLYGGTYNGSPQNDVYSWDGSTWARTSGATLPSPVSGSAPLAFDQATGQLVLFGGTDATGGVATASQSTWIWDALPVELSSTPFTLTDTLSGYDQAFGALQSVQVNTPGSGGWTVSMSASRVPSTGGVSLAAPTAAPQGAGFSVNGSSSSQSSAASPDVGCLDTGCTAPVPSGSIAYPVTVAVANPVTVYSAAAGSGIGRSTIAFRIWEAIRADSRRGSYSSSITITTNYGP